MSSQVRHGAPRSPGGARTPNLRTDTMILGTGAVPEGVRVELVSRRQWEARPARAAPSYLARTLGVKVHYTGAREDRLMLGDHELCAARVRGIQAAHMNGNGWNDIGYTALVCPHGRVFVGRGPHRLPAANGPGLNAGHYAVCALVGNAGLTEPTPAMLHGIRDAIAWLRKEGGAGDQIAGHRDGYPTDCPGAALYRWVRRGAPRPDPKEDDVPQYVSVVAGQRQKLQPGGWRTLTWHREASDSSDQHADGGGSAILHGPALYGVTASVVLEGLREGEHYQVRVLEEGPSAGEGDAGPIGEYQGTPGKSIALYSLAADKVGDGRRVVVQVQHWQAAEAGEVTATGGCAAKLAYWR